MEHFSRDTLFTLYFKNGEKKFFISASTNIEYDEIFYISNSGMALHSVFMDVFCQKAIITGLFDEKGIIDQDHLQEILKIDINFLYNKEKSKKKLLTCLIEKITTKDNAFTLYTSSVNIANNISITKYYSKFCRANLCDTKCHLDLNKDYFMQYEICNDKNYTGYLGNDEIVVTSCNKPDSFYKGGYAFFNINEQDRNKFYEDIEKDNYFIEKTKFLILSHKFLGVKEQTDGKVLSMHILKLHKFNSNFHNVKKVFLLQRCDKIIDTCKMVFDNSKNFQGEPYYNQ